MENLNQQIPNLPLPEEFKTWHGDYHPDVWSNIRKDNIFMLIQEQYDAPEGLDNTPEGPDNNDQPDITIIDNAIIMERGFFEQATSTESYFKDIAMSIEMSREARASKNETDIIKNYSVCRVPTIKKAWHSSLGTKDRELIVLGILKAMHPTLIREGNFCSFRKDNIFMDLLMYAGQVELANFEAVDDQESYNTNISSVIIHINEEVYRKELERLTALARLNQEPCHGGNSCIIEIGQVYMLFEVNRPTLYHRIPMCINCFVKQPNDQVKTSDNPEIFVKKENFKLKLNKVPHITYYDPNTIKQNNFKEI